MHCPYKLVVNISQLKFTRLNSRVGSLILFHGLYILRIKPPCSTSMGRVFILPSHDLACPFACVLNIRPHEVDGWPAKNSNSRLYKT